MRNVRESAAMNASAPRPILVCSPLARSGTNWLAHLLRLHPDCSTATPPLGGEDWLAAHMHHLTAFAEDLAASGYGWRLPPTAEDQATPAAVEAWRATEQDALRRMLGDALLAFARPEPAGRPCIVMKQPTPRGLEDFLRVFPETRFVAIVRDGRDTVASWLRTWPGRSDVGTEAAAWARGVRELERLGGVLGSRLLCLRYEQLWFEPERKLRQVLGHVGLDLARHDWRAALAAPVIGSSEQVGGLGERRWPEAPGRRADFDPLGRHERWKEADRAAFDAAAGDVLRRLGYV